MTLDDGILKIYKTENTAAPGAFPALQLVEPWNDNEYDFGFLTIGNARYYQAAGADSQIDDLVRVWQDRRILGGFYAEFGGMMFRIDRVQHHDDEDGLPVTDLTLTRREEHYDVIAAEP